MFNLYETFDLKFTHDSRPLDASLAESRLKEFAAPDAQGARVIYPQFHVLSADKVTRNRTLYTYAAHKGKNLGLESTGQYSFVQPYRIPIIEQHRAGDNCGLKASDVYGRMVDAKLVKNKETGRAYLAGLGEITHPEAIDEILTGRWLTGSLGSSVGQAHCSICNAPLLTQSDVEDHPHRRGAYYRPAGRNEAEAQDALGFVQCAPGDRNGNPCYTAVDEYRAQEYSKVVMPSDTESLVTNRDSQTYPGGVFTGAPARESAPSADPEDAEVPLSSLWVPMSPSSSRSVSDWGERYVDLVTGRESGAESMGLLHGIQLHEYVDQLSSLALTESAAWAPGIPEVPVVLPLAESEEDQSEPAVVEDAENVLSAKARKDLKPKSFCGPGSSFPAENPAHVTAGLRLLGRYKGPGNKSKIKACLLRKQRKMGDSKETAIPMTKQLEETTACALRVLVPLPAGEKSYDLFPRESAEDRAKQLAVLETMDDLLASLESEDEDALRALLAESATGEEPGLELTVGESNYLVLASIIDHLTESEESGDVPLGEAFTDTEDTKMCDGISTKETMQHVREGLRQIDRIAEMLEALRPEPAAQSTESLVLAIRLSEKILGLAPTESLDSKEAPELATLCAHLSEKALSAEAPQIPAEVPTEESQDPDTPVSEVVLDNPLLGEDATPSEDVAESKPVDLAAIRKGVSGLVNSSLRRDLRRR